MEILDILLKPEVMWFLIGLILLLLEFVVPGLIIIFFGIGGWITSLSCLIFDLSLNMQILIFITTSILSLIALRKSLKKKFYHSLEQNTDELENEFIGKTAVVEKEIKKNMQGKVSFKGTHWEAISETEILPGVVVKIIGKESITLKVEPIDK